MALAGVHQEEDQEDLRGRRGPRQPAGVGCFSLLPRSQHGTYQETPDADPELVTGFKNQEMDNIRPQLK